MRKWWVISLLMLSSLCRAEMSLEVGPMFLSGEYSEGGALILSERFDKYSVSLGYIMEQWVTPRTEPRTHIRENLFVQGQRHFDLSQKWELGVGVVYLNSISRVQGSNFNASLMVRYNINDRFTLNVRHFSNAGSAPPNMGQDMLTIGYNF